MKQWKLESRFDQHHVGLPILKDVDVLVVGGGSAGVAAATISSRNGLSTVLIEKYGFCGGAAVAGLSGTICGLFLASDKAGHQPEQVVFGFAEEFRSRLARRGGVTAPQIYRQNFHRYSRPSGLARSRG